MTRAGDPAEPARRVVLLGASNVIRGISSVVDSACMAWRGPLDFLIAAGHGRSYGMESWVLGRSLPGITTCGLWAHLSRRTARPTAGLLTDIGNDLLYGASVEQVVNWVEVCLQRLRPIADRLVVTQLPFESVSRLDPLRFRLFRSLLFPRSQLSLSEAMAGAERLNQRVTDLADQYEASLVRPCTAWYGFDPIHIKMRHWPVAWKEIFFPWSEDRSIPLCEASLWRWIRLRRLRPLQRRLFGIAQHQSQPAGRLQDGSWISFF